jgi:type IV pilus assembly protein PilV
VQKSNMSVKRMEPGTRLAMSPLMSHKWKSGFTLIEVMVSLVILSVGLLALAGMQGIALGRNVNANQLTVASNLAVDMVERIQFNKWNATAYHNIDTVLGTQPVATQIMATGDYTQWLARLANSRLRGVKGTVSAIPIVTSPTLNQVNVMVTVQWTGDQGDTIAAKTHTVTVTTVIAPE